MRHLQRRIDTMEQAAIDIVKHDPQLNPRLEQLVSVTGIAMKTGPRLLAELASLPGDMSGPQWVAHAGLYLAHTSQDHQLTSQKSEQGRQPIYWWCLVLPCTCRKSEGQTCKSLL